MDKEKSSIHKIIEGLLDQYTKKKIDKESFVSRIKEIYFEDIGFAKVDHHRQLRKNFPEVIYGKGKTNGQILKIAKKILKYSSLLLVTRTTAETYRQLKKEIKNIEFNPEANLIFTPLDISEDKLKEGITVICAGTSDIPVAEEAAVVSYLMGNKVKKIYDVKIQGRFGKIKCNNSSGRNGRSASGGSKLTGQLSDNRGSDQCRVWCKF